MRSIFSLGKLHAKRYQLCHSRRTILHDLPHDPLSAQTGSRFHRVPNVKLSRILRRGHTRNPSLRIIGIRLRRVLFR